MEQNEFKVGSSTMKEPIEFFDNSIGSFRYWCPIISSVSFK